MRVFPGILACLVTTDLLSSTAAHPHQHFHHHVGDDEESRELSVGRCRTAEPTDEAIAESKRAMAEYADQDHPRVTNIAIQTYFHEITNGETGSLTDAEITASIDVLNASFGPTFTFNLAGKTETNNGYWYTNEQSENEFKSQLKVGGCETLNIYSTSGYSYLGFATFPFEGDCNSPLDGVVIASITKPGGYFPYDEGKTLTHEVGHWLGLFHTFQGGCIAPGDDVDDTPAHAAPDYDCINADTCTSAGVNPIENFMNYTPDKCMTEFTSDQFARMITMWYKYRTTASPPTPLPTPQPTANPTCDDDQQRLLVQIKTYKNSGQAKFSLKRRSAKDKFKIIISYKLEKKTVYEIDVCVNTQMDCYQVQLIDSGKARAWNGSIKMYADDVRIYKGLFKEGGKRKKKIGQCTME